MLGRRAFLTTSSAVLLGAAVKPAHPVEEPAALSLKKIVVEEPILYGRPTPAIVAVPRDAKGPLPMAVLLPGGEHTMQKRDDGCWGWWSDFALGDCDAALRRGSLTRDDLRGFATDAQVTALNARLPYRGMILVTPFILRRQTELGPHGAMNLKFLRALVLQVRKEFSVTSDRAGLAGVSAGGLWALWLGAQLDDLFSAIVAVQPYTDGYEKTLEKVLEARKLPQSIRMITSTGDRLHAPAAAFATKHAIEHEAYAGPHEPVFAKGPGGIEALLTLDHALPRPVAASSASSASSSSSASASASASASSAPSSASASSSAPSASASASSSASSSPSVSNAAGVRPRSHLWPFVAAGALAGTAAAVIAARRRRGP